MATTMTVITTEAPHPGNAYRDKYKKIAIAAFVLGGASIILEIINIIIYAVDINGYVNTSGIWCGILFIVVGILAILAHRRPSQCNIIAGMILAIIALIVSFVMMYREGSAAWVIVQFMDGFYITVIIHILLTIVGIFMVITAIFHIVYTSKATCCA